jgi:hypothetical protein
MYDDAMYLEIGVSKGNTFVGTNAPYKVGVDPIPASQQISDVLCETIQYFAVTSDMFFQSISSLPEKVLFDVIFIDGLHTYEQVYRDIENALAHLQDDGVILLHDCKPTSSYCAMGSIEQLREARKKDPTIMGVWTGDVYKAVMRLRATRKDINVFVLDCDWGLGVITKSFPETTLNIPVDLIETFSYEELSTDFEKFINLKPPNYFFTYFQERLNTVQIAKIKNQIASLLNARMKAGS